MRFRPVRTSAGAAPRGPVLVLLLGLCCTAAMAQMPEDLPVVTRMERLSLDEYVEQLRDTSARLEAGDAPAAIASPIPPVWLVEWTGHRSWIHTEWLTDTLDEIETDGEDADTGRERLVTRLAALIQEAESLRADGAEDLPSLGVRFHLEEIMARPEFGLVREPTIWELLLARIGQWLGEFFDSVEEKTSGMFGWSRYLLWFLLFALALLVLYHVVRNMHVRSAEALKPFPKPVAPDRDAVTWWREAREAARRGNWRTALHNGYWAVITRMTEQDRWPEDYSRTHREYLALLPRDSALWNPARELTFRFETTWYGGGAAVEADFQQVRSLWEELHADPS